MLTHGSIIGGSALSVTTDRLQPNHFSNRRMPSVSAYGRYTCSLPTQDLPMSRTTRLTLTASVLLLALTGCQQQSAPANSPGTKRAQRRNRTNCRRYRVPSSASSPPPSRRVVPVSWSQSAGIQTPCTLTPQRPRSGSAPMPRILSCSVKAARRARLRRVPGPDRARTLYSRTRTTAKCSPMRRWVDRSARKDSLRCVQHAGRLTSGGRC